MSWLKKADLTVQEYATHSVSILIVVVGITGTMENSTQHSIPKPKLFAHGGY